MELPTAASRAIVPARVCIFSSNSTHRAVPRQYGSAPSFAGTEARHPELFTGLRLGDLALLDWGNVDRVNGIIAMRSRKTDTSTETRIHPRLAALMEEAA